MDQRVVSEMASLAISRKFHRKRPEFMGFYYEHPGFMEFDDGKMVISWD
jgi:NAD kinase